MGENKQMAAAQTFPIPVRKPSPFAGLKVYAEFVRIGFVNILAFRLRYYTGIITYVINVTVYFFIWRPAEVGLPVAEVLAQVQERDARDRSRAHSPLRAADDAVTLDTTGMSLEAVVERVAGLVAAARA